MHPHAAAICGVPRSLIFVSLLLTLVAPGQFLKQCDSEKRLVHIRSEAEIQGLVQSDYLTKILAIVQALYLVLDCIARTNQGLPISLLELSTAAYVLAAAVMYGFWWHKPQDVAHVTELCENLGHHETRRYKRVRLVEGDNILMVGFGVHECLAPYAFHLVAAMFGGLHLIAWGWDFGSHSVKMIWEVCAVVALALPLFILGGMYAFVSLSAHISKYHEVIADAILPCWIVIVAVSCVCYALARATLIVLSFYMLFSMPVGVYQTVAWTDYLPFIS